MVVVQCEIPSVAASSSCFQTDEWVYTLLTWLIDKQSEIEASIIGTTLTNGSTDFLADGTTRSLYVVMEGFVPTPNQFLGGNIKQLLQSVSLSTVLPALTSFGESAFLSEVMRVLTPEESVSAVHNIVAMPFSDGADSGKSIVSGVNWMQRLNQNSVTTCVFKDYFLSATTPMYTLNMKKIFATIEQSGLRLCGLRTAYVPAETHRIKKSPTSVISKYVHGSILTQPFSSSSREDCHLVLVACFFTPRFVASEQLRNLLGPEDVALARRTDPSSIRALYSNIDEKKLDRALRNNAVTSGGDGIVRNVAFPMAIQATNCWKETLFWFGPRYVPSGTPAPVSASGNMCQSTLMIPSERVVVLGVAIECTDSDFLSMEKDAVYQKASIVSNELSCLQRDALKSIQGLTASTMKVITFWSTNAEEYQKYGLTCQGDSIGPHPLACYLVFLLKTTSSDVHLEQVTGAIAETSARISSHAEHWRATMSLKVRKSFKRYSKPSLLQDVKSQIAQAETASKLDSHDYDNKPQHLEDEDFDSHEDVGLQDVVVIAIPLVLGDDSWGTAKKDVNFGPLIPPQELVLHLMAALPVVSYTTILGVFTSLDDVSDIINPSESTAIMSSTTAAKRVYLCLRGFHLVETISDALQQSIENISVAASMGGGLLPNIAFDARAKLLRIPKVTDFKVLKGKKALDIVGKCFLNIEPRGQHLSLAEQTNFMDFFAQCDSHNFIPQCTLKSQISLSVQALFPPGRFTSLSVVVVPYPREKTSKGVPTHSNGLFIKVFKKLEKAGFDIMSVATKVVDQSMAKYCQEHVELSQASYGSSSYGTHTKEWFDALVGHTVLCVVVAGNSALLRLQPVIGPFDTSVAQENYPLSISASLHQPATSTTKASHLDCHSIRIFQSTTVDATDAMMKMLSNHSYSTADLLQAAQSQEKQMSTNVSSMRPVANLLSDFGSMECHTYQQRYESTSNRQVSVSSLGSSGGVEPAVFEGLRQNSLKEHNAWMAREKEATHTINEIPVPSMSSPKVSNTDVTCIVLTSALLCRVGLSAVLQAVYKEGLRVVQARSELLHTTVAKKLLDLAGQSSLSMKPSLAVLMGGPVLFLALEGNSHVILRLKSILQQPVAAGGGSGMQALHMNVYNPRGLEDAKSAAGFGSSHSLGQLAEDEWGLLASSSSRLARDLLLYCFDSHSSQLVSSSLSITVVSKAQEDTSSSAVHSHTSATSPTATTTKSIHLETSPLPTLPPTASLDDSSFRTPTGSPGSGGILGLGGALNATFPSSTSPKFYTPPTSQKSAPVVMQREYEETKGPTTPESQSTITTTALEELD